MEQPQAQIPQWLTQRQPYTPPPDRDAFIDKSILSVLHVLSSMRAHSAGRGGRFAPHAVWKLGYTLMLVVLLSLARSFTFVAVIGVGLLCRVALLRAEELARVLRFGLIGAAFTGIVLLPAALAGNWYSLGMLTPKVFVSVSALALLSGGTRWNELTGALKLLFVPDLFIFVLDIALKYIYLLGELTLNLLYALRLRSVGKNAGKRSSLSGIAGTLFLRSREMAEDLHFAMVCRGFTGQYKRPARFTMGAPDALMLLLGLGTVALYIVLR